MSLSSEVMMSKAELTAASFAADPLSRFIHEHVSVKMLALSFLILVGVVLVADGMGFHVPKGYLYFAIAFSVGVEALNLAATKRRRRAASANRSD